MVVSSFGLSCPTGGSFYICQNNATEFVGCCTTNPCADGSGNCPKSNLRSASFSGDSYDEIPAQQCSGSSSSTLWYTCQKNVPPFLGCCNTNPCAQGSCPSSSLAPAVLSSNTTSRTTFLAMGADPIEPAPPSNTPSNTPAASSHALLSTGAIAGIAVGGALLLIAIAAFVIYKCGWLARKKKDEKGSFTSPFIPAGLVSYPGGVQPAGSPSMHPYPSPQSPAFGYVSGPGSPHSSPQPYAGYKHTSPVYSSSAGSPPPRVSPFSAYNGSDITYHQPVSELDASSAAVATPELMGSEAGRDWSAPGPMAVGGQRHDRHPTSPRGWAGRNKGGRNVWDGSGRQRGYGSR